MPVLLVPPLAFGPFISGAMLLWGLVAAVPVVLHLLNRRRRQTVAWPAMQFLLQSLQRRSRNIQLWQWLLLLCRVAAVLLIAAALANPVWNQRPPATIQQRSGEQHLMVIDASYSMRASGASGNSRFQIAIERAVQYCQAAADGDSFQVIAMQAEPLAVISRPSLEAGVVQQEIQRLQPSFTAAPLSPTLSLIRRLVPEAETTPSHVVFFTDAQQSTWQAALDGDSQNAWQQLQQRFASVRIVDVTQDYPPATFNAALTSMEATTSDRVSVVTTAFENQHAASQLEVSVEGESVYSNRLQWDDTDHVVTEVPLPVAEQPVVVKASLAGDLLETDNTRWLVRRPAKPLRALCVGSPQATRFVAVALSTAGEQRWDVRQVAVDQLPIEALESREALEPVDLLMICDVARVETPLLETLRRVQSRGGGVVWWLGPAADPAGYDSAAVPFALASPSQSDLYSIDPRGYQHPIAAAFAPYPQSGLLSTPIFRFWQLADSGPHVDADVVLGLGVESEPFVLAQQIAAEDSQPNSVSRSVVVTSIPMVAHAAGSETPWNAMVAWPSLVPLVQEIAAWATAPLQASPSILVGDSISATVAQRDQVPVRVRAPDDQPLEVRSTALETGFGGVSVAWTAGTALQPGIYALEYADQPPQQWAVNVDPGEGDLRPSAVQPLQKLDDSSTENTRTAEALAGAGGDGPQWFRWLLAAAMGLLVTESLISRFALRWQA